MNINKKSQTMEHRNDITKVIIAGSRTFDDYSKLSSSCDSILKDIAQKHTINIVSGCATGADALGERYASEKGYAILRCPADWKRHGKAAGPIRNAEMAACADILICFWDGLSKGTKHMISAARKEGLQIHVIPFLP